MVGRIFRLINREVHGLHEAAYLLALFAFLSQVLALVRDRLFAFLFGAGNVLDIYYASFRIPDLIFVTIASVVSAAILMPFLAEHMEEGKESLRRFIDTAFTVFFAAMVVVSVVVYVLAPWLVPKVLPGFAQAGTVDQVISLTRILLLSPFLLGLSNFFASITQMYRRFVLYAISPLLYNCGIIAGALFLYPVFGINGIAYGVVAGAFLHWFVQVPFMLRQGVFPRLTFNVQFKEIKRVILVSFPRTITLSANQLATFSLISLASLMTAGSISVFNFAFNLQSVPLSIIGVSYSSAAFPMLARFFAEKKHEAFLAQMIVSAQHIIFWSVPLMMLFIVLRAHIVRVILGAGHFSWADTRLTAACLAVFVVSLVAQSLTILFVRAYYAQGYTRKPLMINVIAAFTTIALGYGLVKLFSFVPEARYFLESLLKVDDIAGTIVLVLPLAFTLGSLFNAAMHWYMFHVDFPGFTAPVTRTLFQVSGVGLIMATVAYFALNVLAPFIDSNTFTGILSQGALAGIVASLVGILLLHLLKSHELSEVWKALKAKIHKNVQIQAPEQDTLA